MKAHLDLLKCPTVLKVTSSQTTEEVVKTRRQTSGILPLLSSPLLGECVCE